jgi:hypothetical protein
MPLLPSANENKLGCRFPRGRPSGKGRRTGIRNKATEAMQELLEGEGALLLRKAVDLALEGDKIALRLCLERLLPPARERRIRLDLPKLQRPADITQALGLLLDSVACGDLTPSEGHHLAALLEIQRKAIEMAELEPRIARLERYKDAHPL